jgi:hypothetical protein
VNSRILELRVNMLILDYAKPADYAAKSTSLSHEALHLCWDISTEAIGIDCHVYRRSLFSVDVVG